MTSEVVAMNKEAVALAADSAVTVAGSKIYTTAEKLFMLAPGHPVGLMIYNNAHFMDLPWSIVIKLYRNKLVDGQHQFATLQEYVEDFLTFLNSRGDAIFSQKQQSRFFEQTIDLLLNEMTVHFWQQVKQLYDKGEKIDDAEIAKLVTDSIEQVHTVWNDFPDRYAAEEQAQFVECLLGSYASLIESRRDVFFDQLPLTEENKRKIQELCLFLFTKNQTLPYYTGIVFAGYGVEDLFPICVIVTVESFLCGKLKFSREDDLRIDFRESIARIIPLAQTDVAATILSGVHPAYRRHLKTRLGPHLPPDTLETVLNEVEADMKQEYTTPLLQSVAALPKGELAVIAETLVSTTSFMRKHSMDIESVGGAVGVAVISKKDGFVWIKRKHYFDMEYNQHLLRR